MTAAPDFSADLNLQFAFRATSRCDDTVWGGILYPEFHVTRSGITPADLSATASKGVCRIPEPKLLRVFAQMG